MNPSRGDNDLQLLENIAKTSKNIDTLPIEEIISLADVFHISKLSNQSDYYEKVKKMLCEVLLIQRVNYEDYLKLPKFKKINPEILEKISLFWSYIWLTFAHKKDEERKLHEKRSCGPEPTNYIPYMMHNPQAIKEPRMNCYEYYPTFQPYQKFNMGPQKMAYNPFPYYYNYQNYPYAQAYSNHNNIKYNGYTGENVSAQQRQKIEQIPPNNNRNHLDPPPSNSEIIFKNEYESEVEDNKKSKIISNTITLQFLHCICEGRSLDIAQKYFECPECHNFYHFSCLRITQVDSKPCPLCILTKNHIFTQNYTRSIKSGWLQLKPQECFVTKLHLDEDEINIFRRQLAILESNLEEHKTCSIQLRIMRINDKGKAKSGRKVTKNSFPISLSQLKKVQTRKWLELKLKQINEPSIVFYAITMIKVKEKASLIEDFKKMQSKQNLVEYWLQEQRKQNRKTIVNLVHPLTKRMIQLPVRGEFCQHVECEDLLHFYEVFQSSGVQGNKLPCSFCKNVYTPQSKFTCDMSIYAMLQSRESSNSHKLGCNQQGKLEWVGSDSNQYTQSLQEQMQEQSSSYN